MAVDQRSLKAVTNSRKIANIVLASMMVSASVETPAKAATRGGVAAS